MKKLLTLMLSALMLMGCVACSKNTGNADKGNDGIIEDAGKSTNDVLNGAEDVVDDVTGSDNGGNHSNKNDEKHDSDKDLTTDKSDKK